MICVEIHSNNVLTVRDNTFSNAVSDGIKHETVKFLFSDNWNDYQKTAVFSAEGVEAINVLLTPENSLCVAEDECYIPFEVLKGDRFAVSVYGVNGDKRATSTSVQIEVLESGYAVGEAPKEPTQDQYSQIISIMTDAKAIAQSVRDDADAGVFKGEKGDQGEPGLQGEKGERGPMGPQGEKGEMGPAAPVDEIYEEIDGIRETMENTAIKRVVSGKFLYLDDVSSLSHTCSCRLTNKTSKNLFEYGVNNIGFVTLASGANANTVYPGMITDNKDGSFVMNGTVSAGDGIEVCIRFDNLQWGEEYTVSIRNSKNEALKFKFLGYSGYDEQTSGVDAVYTTQHTFTKDEHTSYYELIYLFEDAAISFEETTLNDVSYFVQIEKEDIMTEWCPAIETNGLIEDFSEVKVIVSDGENSIEYKPNADGTVTGIMSTSPTMEITTDNEYANITEFTYCVDTKKYVDNISGGENIDLSDYYTKEEVDNEIATFDFIKIVSALPEEGLPNRMYLVPKENEETQDLFDEYLWVNGAWEWITTKQVEIDLTEYVKNTDYATTTTCGVVKATQYHGLKINNGDMEILPAYETEIEEKKQFYRPITPLFLDLAVKTGVTTNTIELTDEEKNAAMEWLGIKDYIDKCINEAQ